MAGIILYFKSTCLTLVLTYLKNTRIAKKALKINIRDIDRKVSAAIRRLSENVQQ